MASSSRSDAAARSSKAPATKAANQENGSSIKHIDWSIYPSLTVKFAFLRRLTFCNVKRYTTSYVTLGGKHYPYSVLWGMTVHSRVRRFFIAFVEWPWFDRTSLILIVVNVIAMMLSRPTIATPGLLERIFAWSDPIFSILFTIEMVCKLMASGLILTPNTYLRDGWNWIDAAVVLSAWITWETPGVVVSSADGSAIGQALKPLRTVRVLRPLRTVTRVRGMRVVIQSLLRSVPEMASVLAIQGFLFVFFGIFGVQLFAGKLRWRCVPEEIAVEPCARNRSLGPAECWPSAFSDECVVQLGQQGASDYEHSMPPCLPIWASSHQLGDYSAYTCDGSEPDSSWNCMDGGVCTYFTSNPNNNITSFDHFPVAFVTIFYSMTLEGWVDAMYMLMAGDRAVAWLAVLFFAVLILVGAVFVFNLLLAVVFDNFSSINAESRAEAEAEEAETQKHHDEKSEASGRAGDSEVSESRASDAESPAVEPSSPLHPHALTKASRQDSTALTMNAPRSLKGVVSSAHFETCIIVAIIANTCFLALDWSPPPFGMTSEEMFSMQFTTSALFSAVFTLEMALKMKAFTIRGYFKNVMNRFDFFIVASSIIELIVLIVFMDTDNTNASSALSILRTLKGLRTLRLLRLMNMVKSMRKVVLTMTKSAGHIMYLFMILILFCIIFALLGMETMAQPMVLAQTRYRYDDIYYSMINVFIVLSGENWNDLLFEAGGYVGPWSPIFYILLLVACNWVMLNLFVAILLANINDLAQQEQNEKLRVARALLRRLAKVQGSMRFSTKRSSRSSKDVTAGISGRSNPSNQGSCRSFVSGSDATSDSKPTISPGTELGKGVTWDKAAAPAPSPPPSPPYELSVEVKSPIKVDDLGEQDPGCLRMCSLFLSWNSTLASNSGGTQPQRGRILQIVEHQWFANTIQILIAISSFVLILDLPGTLPDEAQAQARTPIFTMEVILTVLFSLEALLKFVAYGIGGYFSNSWNLLDFFVVVISWPALFLPNLAEFSFFRALRSIRMLKFAAMHEGMRVVVVSLYYSLPAIVNVMMVLIVFLVIFGILGMQLNAGRWAFCDVDLFADGADPYSGATRSFTVFNRTECVDVRNGTWMNPHFGHFDTIFHSMLLLFETATLERWPDVMLYMADAAWDQSRPLNVAPEPPPDNAIYLFVFLFWVAWIFSSAFVIMNLFVGVVVETFQRNTDRSDGTIFLTERQQKWLLVMQIVTLKRGARIPVPPDNPIRKKVFYFVTSYYFEMFIIGMIVCSVIAMATNMYVVTMTPVHKQALEVLNYIFCVVFVCECILKLFGLGVRRYFRDGWNDFDFVLVCFSIVDLVLDTLDLSTNFDPVFMRAFRLVRIGRLLRLIRGFKPMLKMIDTLATSLPALVNVLGLLSLLLFIYAIAGVSLFHNVSPQGAFYLGGVVGFKSFPEALLTLFRCVTGESWNGIMHDLMINDFDNPRQCSQADPPHVCASPVLSGIFFVSFTVFATFMLLNMLIGVILQNFSNTLASGSVRCILPEQIDEFGKAWLALDPTGSHQLPESKLPSLLHSLRVFAWVYGGATKHAEQDLPVSFGESIVLSRKLRVKTRDGRINFQETLQSISRAIHHGFDEVKHDELIELEREHFRPLDPNLLKTIAGASHEEVARARARMRKMLAHFHYRSLVRTGQVSREKRRFKAAGRATLLLAARVVQVFWRARQMKFRAELLRNQRNLGSYYYIPAGGGAREVHDYTFTSYVSAIYFIATLKIIMLYRRHDYANRHSASAMSRYVSGMDAPEPLEADSPGALLAMNTLTEMAKKHSQTRAPMSTSYAAMIIQNGWRATLERRGLRAARIFVKKMQANWRGAKARGDSRKMKHSIQLSLRYALKFKRMLNRIRARKQMRRFEENSDSNVGLFSFSTHVYG